jgi:hypothetical protein
MLSLIFYFQPEQEFPMQFTKKLLIISALVVIPVAFAGFDAMAAKDAKGGTMKLDTNKDNAVDKAEFDAANKARFDGMDTNKDGKISADEMKKSREKKSDAQGKKDKKSKKNKKKGAK